MHSRPRLPITLVLRLEIRLFVEARTTAATSMTVSPIVDTRCIHWAFGDVYGERVGCMLATGVVLREVATERLEAEVSSFAAELSAAKCEWVLMIGELDRREAWATWECRSMADWLSWHCGLSKRAGREQVRGRGR